MTRILNYKTSPHFVCRMNERQIEPFLVSLCLSKGKMEEKKKSKIEFTLSKEKILDAIKMEYLSITDYLGLETLTVVTRSNVLITVFCRYADTGLSNLVKIKNYG